MKDEIFKRYKDGVAFDLLLQPRCASTKLSGFQGGALKLRVCSPPVDNKANDESRKYMAGIFSVANRDVEIIKGLKSRRKKVYIKKITPKQAAQVVHEHIVD